MKVLVLQSELGVLRGGGENFTRNLFTAFAQRGHRVAAAFVADRRGRYPLPLPPAIEPIPIAGWWSMNLGQEALAAAGRYIPGESFRKKWDRLQQGISWRTIQWHRGRFQRRVEAEFANRWGDYDAVYVHSNLPLASKVARHRPTVMRLPGPVEAECAGVLRSVHAVCANGDALAQIRTFLGDHAVELPIGLDNQLFTPNGGSVRSRLGWGDKHRVIGYVGRLTHLKGVDLLAAAFRKFLQRAPDARLLVIGSGAEERNIVPVLAKELARGIVHIEPDIPHRELPEWYRAMNLLVMPSRYENFSNALLEGMACGVPFLASDVGGNRILAETGAGWLFQSNSVSSLSANLQSIINDAGAIKARAAIGIRYVQEHNTWAATADRLEWIIASRLGVKS